MFDSAGSVAGIGNTARSITSIKVPYPGTIVIYDHWEDGYETDITVPVQPTTAVWGDGILANGVAPGYADDIIPAGGYMIMDNTFSYNPRNQSEVVYDGKDKVFTSADVSISKVASDSARFAVQNVKSDVIDTRRFGRFFRIGFGEDTNIPTGVTAFRYMSPFVRHGRRHLGATGYNGDGTFDVTSPTSNEGEVWFYDGTGSSPGSVLTDVNNAK